jgi:uncharacterized protein
MRLLLLLIMLSFAGVTAFGQSPDKTKKIRKFMEAIGYTNVVKQSMESMFELFEKNYPKVDTAFWNEFRKEIASDDLTKLIIPIYDKYFTESDLDALIEFYSTPAGIKVRDATPLITREAMAAGAEWGKAVGDKVAKKLVERGYELSQ